MSFENKMNFLNASKFFYKWSPHPLHTNFELGSAVDFFFSIRDFSPHNPGHFNFQNSMNCKWSSASRLGFWGKKIIVLTRHCDLFSCASRKQKRSEILIFKTQVFLNLFFLKITWTFVSICLLFDWSTSI